MQWALAIDIASPVNKNVLKIKLMHWINKQKLSSSEITSAPQFDQGVTSKTAFIIILMVVKC